MNEHEYEVHAEVPVVYLVTAKSKDEAVRKAKAGEFDEIEHYHENLEASDVSLNA